MLRLMKLEWKKHKLSSYFKGVAICIIAIFAAVSLMALGIKAEGDVLFFDFTQQMVLINTFIRITFIPFQTPHAPILPAGELLSFRSVPESRRHFTRSPANALIRNL